MKFIHKYHQPNFVVVQNISIISSRINLASRCIVGGSDSLEEAEALRNWFEDNIQPNREDSEYYMGPSAYYTYEVMRP